MNQQDQRPHPARIPALRPGNARPHRQRAEDRPLDFLFASAEADEGAEAPPAERRGSFQIRGVRLRDQRPEAVPLSDAQPTDDGVLLLDLGGDDALLVAGAALRRLPRGGGGQELLERAVAGAGAWQRERARSQRRLQLAEHMLAYADRLGGATTAEEVRDALMEHAVLMVGGYAAMMLVREGTLPELRAGGNFPEEVEPLDLVVPLHARFARPGVLTIADAAPNTGAPFSDLAPLFVDARVSTLVHQPVGDQGVLVLLERRRDRLFEPEDWDLLQALARQAAGALERIRLVEEVRQLSLTDPLTGLANRRRLDLMLEHSLAAAQRGEPLAVVMIDLDGFKAINDEHGHVRGDRTLRLVATCLRTEARGSDLVARYGGDEFLLVLPGGDRAGAQALLQRVRERLGGQVRFSAGLAEYQSGVRSAEELVERADRDLYRSRSARGASPSDG